MNRRIVAAICGIVGGLLVFGIMVIGGLVSF
jgi:hypothetical protein